MADHSHKMTLILTNLLVPLTLPYKSNFMRRIRNRRRMCRRHRNSWGCHGSLKLCSDHHDVLNFDWSAAQNRGLLGYPLSGARNSRRARSESMLMMGMSLTPLTLKSDFNMQAHNIMLDQLALTERALTLHKSSAWPLWQIGNWRLIRPPLFCTLSSSQILQLELTPLRI